MRFAARSVFIILLFSGMLSTAGRAGVSALELKGCSAGHARVAALCGSYKVFEDRASRTGRKVTISFIVLKAETATNKAIFWNPGGPGAGATQFADLIADGLLEPYLTRLRDRYNIVLVDNRGTGASNELSCDLYHPAEPAPFFLQLWPDAALRKCRAALARAADLGKYTTDLAADDLDDIRAALNFPKIALSGVSGGTQFFLDYARRHPDHVESLLLQGVAPPHFLIIPLEDARGAQLAIDHLMKACDQDRACAAQFPSFRRHFAALAARFDRGPVTIKAHNPVTHEMQTLLLSKEVFGDRLRQTTYERATAAYVPFIIERAYRRDYEPLATMVQDVTADFGALVPAGVNLSITCAEDIPFITGVDVTRASTNTFVGDSRVRAQQRACQIWNIPAVPRAYQDPVRTAAPLLMISGADDPTTPPEYSLEALPYFRNGARLVIANTSHDTYTVPCAMRLAEEFIRRRSSRKLDTAGCAGVNRRPPFRTSMEGFDGHT